MVPELTNAGTLIGLNLPYTDGNPQTSDASCTHHPQFGWITFGEFWLDNGNWACGSFATGREM
jgi:hypothetical protein